MKHLYFIQTKNNTVKSLTLEQVRKIYTGEITNWKDTINGSTKRRHSSSNVRNY